jgi:hypothetical protein
MAAAEADENHSAAERRGRGGRHHSCGSAARPCGRWWSLRRPWFPGLGTIILLAGQHALWTKRRTTALSQAASIQTSPDSTPKVPQPQGGVSGERWTSSGHGSAQGKTEKGAGRGLDGKTMKTYQQWEYPRDKSPYAWPPGKPRRGTRDVVVVSRNRQALHSGKTMEVRGNLGPGTVSLRANAKYEVQDERLGGGRGERYQVHGVTLE